METKRAIQRYWFGEVTAEKVLELYGIGLTNPKRESVMKILVKTKKDFNNGWSFFTRESIDLKIRKILG